MEDLALRGRLAREKTFDLAHSSVRALNQFLHGQLLESGIAHIDVLNKFKEVYVICQSGGRSSTAVAQLLPEKIIAINVAGGTSAWRAAGLPIA